MISDDYHDDDVDDSDEEVVNSEIDSAQRNYGMRQFDDWQIVIKSLSFSFSHFIAFILIHTHRIDIDRS